MSTLDTTSPVMVTGATGYVAGWLVKKLLEEGFTVHAAVRDPANKNKVQHLDAIAQTAPGTIRYFKADLLDNGSYAEAMAGCGVVFHTASPFIVEFSDPQTELVDPAKLGTRNVLEQANQTPSVERVVLTSSCAAIYGDNVDQEQTPEGVFTEEVWNTSSNLQHNPYAYSKTVAEKEAWAINEGQQRWQLVVINPSLVVGPGLNPHATSASFDLVRQLGDGTMKAGVPHWGMGAVDVRDLAEAHFRAAFNPDAKGRHIVSAHNTSFQAMAATLLDTYGNSYPLPRRTLPKWLLWLVGPLANKAFTRPLIARNVGYDWTADNRKSLRDLDMQYRSLSESMHDMFQQLIDSGQLKPAKK
ncbi:NAD-dependent epimerase/dehydratase family protein [Marinobacter caseinilyticus]|uniref:NAD-dependent epimerase/dehydratase family protein n=1 Tax=Marinobacter caseinilyticus TaxID=2692195 RepID=UPI00140DF468|nr:NAD-dependent epimerase/dehydratase family protein [Marinobacter caseinilyticus]